LLSFLLIFMPLHLFLKFDLVTNILSCIMSFSFPYTHTITDLLSSTLIILVVLSLFDTKSIFL
jgi:hypothetical protein